MDKQAAYELGACLALKEAGFNPSALKTLLRRAAIGAGVGGVGGALAGHKLTGDVGGAGKGALTGALLGGLVGGKIPLPSRIWA